LAVGKAVPGSNAVAEADKHVLIGSEQRGSKSEHPD
jgi:hypothetical protein